MLRTMTITTAALVVTLALFAPAANAVLVDVDVDGVVTAGEGYGAPLILEFQTQDKKKDDPICLSGASLWMAQTPNAATGLNDLCVAFSLPRSTVDNSYGDTNSIGWVADAPSGKHHNFQDLLDSDKARFVFHAPGDEGKVLFDVTMDYLAEKDGGYIGGATGVGDFAIDTGEVTDVLESSTSLAHNWDILGSSSPEFFGKDSDSPAALGNIADPDYGNPTELLWVYDVIYEFKIAGSVFDGLVLDLENPRFLLENPGFLTIEVVHASPCKEDGKPLTNFTPLETSQGDLPGAVPEPLTVFGLLAGLGGMAGYIRKRRMA